MYTFLATTSRCIQGCRNKIFLGKPTASFLSLRQFIKGKKLINRPNWLSNYGKPGGASLFRYSCVWFWMWYCERLNESILSCMFIVCRNNDINKGHTQFFPIFDTTPSPKCKSSYIYVLNFWWDFDTSLPPPLLITDVLYGWPFTMFEIYVYDIPKVITN